MTLCTLLLLGALITNSSAALAAQTSARLFHDPLQPLLVEPPHGNPTVAGDGSHQTRADPVRARPSVATDPDILAKQATKLALSSTAPELAQAATILTANPQLLPEQTESAALDAGLLGELFWVLPPLKPGSNANIATFTEQLKRTGIATAGEADSFHPSGNGFRSKIRGLPVNVQYFSRQLDIKSERPLHVHIDLGFFFGLYSDEVKTPVLPLTIAFAETVQGFNWPIKSVTISYSPRESQVPLNFRFVGNLLAQLVKSPELCKNGWPTEWLQFSQALYLATFLKNTESADIYRSLCKEHPKNADFHFAYYRSLRSLKRASEAFKALDQAIAVDPAYGAEYWILSQTATEASQNLAALQMIKKALEITPEAPQVKIAFAELLISSGHASLAIPILDQLSRLPWSPTYHPEARQLIDSLQTRAATAIKQKAKEPPKPQALPPSNPIRQATSS